MLNTRLSLALATVLFAGCEAEMPPEHPDALVDEERDDLEASDELAVDVDPSAAPSSCCYNHLAPGCDQPSVQSCVCAADPYCCNTHWDSICVGEVESLGCGQCNSAEPCCDAHPNPGCNDVGVQECVCDVDPYCCNNQWDSICVDEVDSLGCGTCAPDCVTPQQLNAIMTAFEPCPSGNAIGQTEGISGVTCEQVCCAFGYGGCERRAGQADYDACNPSPPIGNHSCSSVFASSWSSQCVCTD